jgi:hypothetical protein
MLVQNTKQRHLKASCSKCGSEAEVAAYVAAMVPPTIDLVRKQPN